MSSRQQGSGIVRHVSQGDDTPGEKHRVQGEKHRAQGEGEGEGETVVNERVIDCRPAYRSSNAKRVRGYFVEWMDGHSGVFAAGNMLPRTAAPCETLSLHGQHEWVVFLV